MHTKALKRDGKDTLLRLRIQPRASKNAIEGSHGDQIRVRLTAPPVEGKANKALIAYLARALGVKKAQLSIEFGDKSRDKVVRVRGVQPEALETALLQGASQA